MILFRTDSSFQVGTGHVVRCLHLAGLLKQLNHEILFLCQDLPGNIMSQISGQGFQVQSFSPIQGEKDSTIINQLNPSWVVVDHYGLDENWEKSLLANTKIFVIDDLMNRKHFCQVLLNQNYHRDFSAYKNLVPISTKLLTGPQFCLLGPDLKKSQIGKKMSSPVKLISFFGGSDSTGELLKLIENLIASQFPEKISFVALKSHQHLDRLKALKLPRNFNLVIDPPNWHQLLSQSDFYIGSGGTVTWERFFLGLPGAVIAVAENQENASQELAEDGFQHYWGPSKNFNYSQAAQKIYQALSKTKDLEDFSQKSLNLVGKFDLKLAQEIFGLGQS